MTEMFLAVAWPNMVSLTDMLMSMKGTVAAYSVGFVILTLAPIVSDDLAVSRISRLPTSGEKVVILPPDIAGVEFQISLHDGLGANVQGREAVTNA